MVVRVADIIGYIGRDIEDAITVKLIHRKDIPCEVVEVLGNRNDTIINRLALDLIENSFDKNYLAFGDEVFSALGKLKSFNYENIYLNPLIKGQNDKIKRMFELLFETYLDDLRKKRVNSPIYKFFISHLNTIYLDNTALERIVIDFISGMTDDFFNNQFKKIFIPTPFGMEI